MSVANEFIVAKFGVLLVWPSRNAYSMHLHTAAALLKSVASFSFFATTFVEDDFRAASDAFPKRPQPAGSTRLEYLLINSVFLLGLPFCGILCQEVTVSRDSRATSTDTFYQ